MNRSEHLPFKKAEELTGISHVQVSRWAKALEIGRMLCEVKKELPHGEWLNWIKDNTSYSQPQCSRYVNLAKYSQANSFDEDWGLLQHFRELIRGKKKESKGEAIRTKIPTLKNMSIK